MRVLLGGKYWTLRFSGNLKDYGSMVDPGNAEGRLIRIGTFSSVATHWLPQIIREFQKSYPNIDYELLLGDYTEIEELVLEKVTGLIFMGLDNSKLHQFFNGKVDKIVDVQSMEDCVKEAYKMAKPGETVLLSPCCASFDLFQNYEDRGKQFKSYVRNL